MTESRHASGLAAAWSNASWARLARLAGLLMVKVAAGAWAMHEGFSHVSDDDYARVVIAERFAHAPSFDPSGTSWLPCPFWIDGGAMLVLGRSLSTAVTIAWLSGLASVLIGYAALRAAAIPRVAAWLTAALVGSSPWNAWLGVATVPEALTAALTFTGAMTLATAEWRTVGAVSLLVASLSRYEAWPVCAVFAGACAVDSLRTSGAARTRGFVAAGLALAGPAVWLAWNAHAHGAPLHFLARVTAFHESHTDAPLAGRLLAYPFALVTGAPEIAALGALGGLGGAEVRARWRRPLLAMAALVLFLEYGERVGGAPTHHPERALLAVWWVLAAFGVDGLRALVLRHVWARPKREAWAVALGVAAAGALASARVEAMRAFPGAGPEEDRASQVARGLALRSGRAASATIVPCAYEHFALIGAFGAPERVTVLASVGGPVTGGCPGVQVP